MSDQLPLILGIETSGREGSLALVRGDEMVAHRQLETTGRRHAQTLVAELALMCREAQVQPHEITAVGVSIGPGSFTGLRVGCTVAKTLCYTTGAKLLAVDSLLASATAWSGEHRQVWAIEDAQRGELFVGHYQQSSNGFSRSDAIQIVKSREWLAGLKTTDILIGPGLSRIVELSTAAQRIEASVAAPPATTIARLAQKLYGDAQFSDPWTLEPFYARLSAAEEKAAKARS